MTKQEGKALAAEKDRIMSQLAAQRELSHPTATPGINGKHDPLMVDSLRGRLQEVERLLAGE